jgi:hypothetical protein
MRIKTRHFNKLWSVVLLALLLGPMAPLGAEEIAAQTGSAAIKAVSSSEFAVEAATMQVMDQEQNVFSSCFVESSRRPDFTNLLQNQKDSLKQGIVYDLFGNADQNLLLKGCIAQSTLTVKNNTDSSKLSVFTSPLRKFAMAEVKFLPLLQSREGEDVQSEVILQQSYALIKPKKKRILASEITVEVRKPISSSFDQRPLFRILLC